MPDPNHSAVLPTGALPSAAMDYEQLRAEAVQLLGHLAGSQWTDYNTHDPGITILEQLCYALTDLGYRAHYPMADLLAADPSKRPPGPREILPCDPVTEGDLRQVALGFEAVENAWVAPTPPAVAVYHHPATSELRFEPPSTTALPVSPGGCRSLSLQLRTDPLPAPTTLADVRAQLHAQRLLGSDLVVQRVQRQVIGLQAELEVEPAADPTAVMVGLLEAVDGYLAPRAEFVALAQAEAAGESLSELLQGPALPPERGVLKRLPPAPTVVHRSSLVRALGSVPGVVGVRQVRLAESPTAPASAPSSPSSAPGYGDDLWSLPLPPGHVAQAPADLASPPQPGRIAGIQLYRGGAPVAVDPQQVQAQRLQQRRAERAQLRDMRDLSPPAGRDRDVGHYASILNQFPTTYGLRPIGLPESASPARKAQALQLEAYLYLFDQLLANLFAQLGYAHTLLSDGGPGSSYASQPAADPTHDGTFPLVVPAAGEFATWLADAVEPGDPTPRRLRFLGHLLARYGEQVDPLPSSAVDPGAGEVHPAVAQRRAFLKRCPDLSRGRGSGVDLLAAAAPEGLLSPSLFEARLRLRLGLPDSHRFVVIEHVLLRPRAGDAPLPTEAGAEVPPLLTEVREADPFTARLTLVFEEHADPDSARKASLERAVQAAVVRETPAHLHPRLLWLTPEDYDPLAAAEDAHRRALKAYLQAPTEAAERKVRGLRDRVIDLLVYEADGAELPILGRTYPLADIPLAATTLTVASGATAQVTLQTSQTDVGYWLVLDGTTATAPVQGTGAALSLTSPPIEQDGVLRIRAAKLALPAAPGGELQPTARQVWLRQAVTVLEGVDPAIGGVLVDGESGAELPPLPSASTAEQARIAAYGSRVAVDLQRSQEGVSYVVFAQGAPETPLSEPQAGLGGPITLTLSEPVSSDQVLRVRGTRAFTDGRTDLADLELRLQLCVYANPDLPGVALQQAVLRPGQAATVRLQGAQPGIVYRAYQVPVRSAMYHLPVAGDPPAPTVEVPLAQDAGATAVQLLAPALAAVWQETLVVGGESLTLAPCSEPVAAQAPEVELPLVLPEAQGVSHVASGDHLLILQATKTGHQSTVPGLPAVSTAVPLRTPLGLLRMPDPNQALTLSVVLEDGAVRGPIRFSAGQPGVFYTLYGSDPQPLGEPVYFHRRSERQAEFNKGIEQLRVAQDLVIARPDPSGAALVQTRTDPHLHLAQPLPVGTVLSVHARKALSHVETFLEQEAILRPAPALEVQPSAGGPAGALSLVIKAAVVDEVYQVFTAAGQAVAGPVQMEEAGPDLTVALGTPAASTSFELRIQRLGDGLPVVRSVFFLATVAATAADAS